MAVSLGCGWRAWRAWHDVVVCEQLFLEADAQMNRSQWDQALNTLDACLVKNPLYFPAYEAKAYVLLEARGDRQGALAALQSAMPALADDARLQRAIGELYLRDLKLPALALPYLRRACELDSTDYTARALEKKAQTALEQQVRNPAAHRVP